MALDSLLSFFICNSGGSPLPGCRGADPGGGWSRPLVTLPPFPLREAQGGQRLVLVTLHEEEFEFRSPSSVAIAELVAMFLQGLKERSVFAMALQDRKATGTQPGGEGTGEGGWLARARSRW